MGYSAKILRDSVGPNGIRLTTFEVSFPRIVLAEYNTHRAFSRNSASSRAIPVEKMLMRVEDDPFIPLYWGKNQRGMQADQELTASEQIEAETVWLDARNLMVGQVRKLVSLGVHKQIANRLLEPFLYHTVICTSSEYANFFALRRHKGAQPEIRRIAEMMFDLYAISTPNILKPGEWHLPLVDDQDKLFGEGFSIDQLVRICVGRCCRVSYLTHDGKRDPQADIDLASKLGTSGHMSPFEHAAMCLTEHEVQWSGNIKGWLSYRKTLPGEAIFTG